jgi:transcriptional regulator with XRE-family HTH domain
MPQPTNAEVAIDLRIFGRNLCLARELIGLEQRDFARVSGFDRSTISKIECGRQAPKFDTLLTLARVSMVKPAELLSGIGPITSLTDPPDDDRPPASTPAAQFGANLKWRATAQASVMKSLAPGPTPTAR